MVGTATEILLVARMANLVVGVVSGIPMGVIRQGGAEVVPKYLTMVHLAGLMQGPILIAVGFALTISTVSPWIDTTTAIVLAVASALLIAKDTLNWRQGVTDEFAQQTPGLRIGQLFGPLELIGIVAAAVCVTSGL